MGREKAAVPVLHVRGLVLAAALAGESHVRLTVLCETRGRLACLQRRSRSAKGERADLFDEAELVLEGPKASGVFFVKEYRCLRRYSGIGRSYAALECASEFARVLARNAEQGFDVAPFVRIARLAFETFETAKSPQCALIKLFALLARDEGYPLREDFLANLPSGEREIFDAILHRPLDAQTAAPAETERALEKLRRWLKDSTDIWMP